MNGRGLRRFAAWLPPNCMRKLSMSFDDKPAPGSARCPSATLLLVATLVLFHEIFESLCTARALRNVTVSRGGQADVVHFIKGYLGNARARQASKKSTWKAQPCLLRNLKIGGNHISMTASAGTTQPALEPQQFRQAQQFKRVVS